jgi:hypothetical protein
MVSKLFIFFNIVAALEMIHRATLSGSKMELTDRDCTTPVARLVSAVEGVVLGRKMPRLPTFRHGL